MKKKILFMFLILFFPLSVYASSIKLTCPAEVSANSEFTCKVTGNTSASISALSAKVITPDELKFLAFIPSSNWQGDGADGEIDLYSADDFTGNFEIGTLKFEVIGKAKTTITVNEAAFYANADTYKLDNNHAEVIIKEVSNNPSSLEEEKSASTPKDEETEATISSAYLIDILIDKYVINFDKNTFNYVLKIADEEKLNIEPVLEDNSSKYEIIGNRNLKNGAVISIVVTDINGNNNKYSIKIEKDNYESKKNYRLIFIIIIGVLVILNALRFIVKNKQKSKVGDSV